MFKIAGFFLGSLIVISCILMSWFAWRLLPFARAGIQPTPVPEIIEVTRLVFAPTQTSEPTPTFTNTPTQTPNPTMTSTSTVTPSPTLTSTHTATPVPSDTPTPDRQLTFANPVWTRQVPENDAPQYLAISADTAVEIVQISGDWIEIRWEDRWQGEVTAWIRQNWVDESN